MEALENIEALLGGTDYDMEYRIITKSGLVKFLHEKTKTIYDEDGISIKIIGVIQDITEVKELNKVIAYKEKEIHNVEKRYENIIKESKEGFIIIDSNGIIRYSSFSVEKIIGYTSEEMLNTIIYKIFKGEEIEVIKNMLEYVSKNPEKSIGADVLFTTKYGKEIYMEIYITNLIHEPCIRGILLHCSDVTKKIKIQKQLIYDVNHDKRTGLKSRKKLLEDLKKLNTEAELQDDKYALIMIDVDGLKQISFSLGYNVGNKLILKFVDRLKTIFTDDRDISRYSEDVFAIITKEKDGEDFEELAERIIELFSKPFKVDLYELLLKINMGICIFPKEEKDNLHLTNCAKIALIRAKKQGEKSYMFYSPEVNIKHYKDVTLRNDLFNAIEKDQLEVYYQPIVDIKSNEIISAEALIRWNHPEWGLVPPREFIQIAEETDFIIDIGKWVIREVCKNYNRWLNNKMPTIKISVNLSGIQFFEDGFVNNIKKIIEQFNLKPDFLIMEITENILLTNKEKVIEDIKGLKSMGVEIALDDFGTGFSSLSYLKDLSIDILK